MAETTMHAAARTPGTVAQPAGQAPMDELKASLRKLLATLIDQAFGLALETVEVLASSLDEVAARSGPKLNALLGGLRAWVQGRNPVWGAIRRAMAAMRPAAKAALIVALVLALLLLPLTVVLLLLGLIVIAVWVAGGPAHADRGRRRGTAVAVPRHPSARASLCHSTRPALSGLCRGIRPRGPRCAIRHDLRSVGCAAVGIHDQR